ncbi:PD-(D/E)XK nuclease-like domain-containing protein [Streptomyces sp. NPDC059569]|uniref:PD-(D/E)XK nuclease-like domain-containing protein n=1 Tax=Streptomyces sp. NPDC059569 TaxID=3346869 RepID=UPI0036C8C8C3
MTATAFTVAEPGIYPGVPDAVYHADPVPGGSLSSTGATKLLPPSCPALFQHDRVHGQAPRGEFDFGHAVHSLVLGEGPEVAVLDFADWRSKAAHAAREEARDAGLVPVLAGDWATAKAMAHQVAEHPAAGTLFQGGTSEVSLFWQDKATGLWCRGRIDYLRQLTGLTLSVDYKTTKDASPDAIRRAIHEYGYNLQAAWYMTGLEALRPDDEQRFVFVFQQKTAPYLITVRELDQQALDIGRAKAERALRLYAECTAADRWPDWTGPVADIPFINLPTWAAIRDTEEYVK